MSQSHRIRLSDITPLLQLANELHELPGNIVLRHEHMLQRLCALTGAMVGISEMLMPPSPKRRAPQRLMLVYQGWSDEDQRNAANIFFRARTPLCPVTPKLLQIAMRGAMYYPVTRTRRQIVDDSTWYRSDYVQHSHRAMGLDDGVYSALPLSSLRGGPMTTIRLFRPWGSRPRFMARERKLLRLFHSQALWLFRPQDLLDESHRSISNETSAEFSPRQRQTLHLLLAGDSEKQVAGKLHLSRHTVHEHVKAIYRNVGVSSRGELMARFMRRRAIK